MGFSFPALYFIKKNPGIEVMQYKHSLDESGVVEFFRRRVSVGFIGNSLGVNTHLMAFLRSMCLFMKFFSDTTISYEAVRGESDFTE